MERETGEASREGVMDAAYAAGRTSKPHLRWRLKMRALVAAQAYWSRRGRGGPVDLLELGAAEGRTMLELREQLGPGGRFVGIELSDSLLEQAPALPENVELRKGDVLALPDDLEAASFDLCTVLAVLEHLPDPLACVEEAYRMLRPGGVLVATCPNPFWDRVAGSLGLVADEHHEVEVDRRYLARLAEEAGFADIETRSFMWVLTGALPYLGIEPPPSLALQIDEQVQNLGLLDFSFVNQVLVAQKPAP